MKIQALDKSGYRNFGVITALIIVLIFGLLIPWAFNVKLSIWPWVFSTIFLTWAFFIPKTLVIVYNPWMKLSYYMGILNGIIILSFVFFVIITPFALWLKLLGKDAMNRKFNDKTIKSSWKKSEKQLKDRMEKVY